MDKMDRFGMQTEAYYGPGCSKKLGRLLEEKGYRRAALLVDENVAANSGYYSLIKENVGEKADILREERIRGSEEPDYDYLDEVADRIRSLEGLEAIVAIGGGSCLDMAKAVAVLYTNGGKGISYRGFDQVQRPGLPTFAVPTTAGTGSEVTNNAVFTDKKEMKKLGINGRYMNAAYAFLDAEWTLSCPRGVAVSSGMDALVHALESFMNHRATMLTRAFSREAFKTLYEALPSLVHDPENRERRQELLLGSFLAAVALFNSGSGIAGALSYPLGVHFKVPHGIGGGIFISSVIDYNIERGYEGYAELLDMIRPMESATAEEKCRRFSRLLHELSETLGVPRYLTKWGVTRENLEETARLMRPLQAAFDQNPQPFSADREALEMLRSHVE